jgi:hypothetical protein
VVPETAVVPAIRQPGRTEHMEPLIAELQEVAKIAPDAVW